MKLLIPLLTLALLPGLALAKPRFRDPDNRYEHCNDEAPLAELQRSIVKDVGEKMKTARPDELDHFRFTKVLDHGPTGEVTAYFEVAKDAFSPSRAYFATYAVNIDTCGATMEKIATFLSEEDPTDTFPKPDLCNERTRALPMREEAKKFLRDLVSQIVPENEVRNFSFSNVIRYDGTSDLVVIAEAGRSGTLSIQLLGHFRVDPQTCKVENSSVTAFDRWTSTPVSERK